MASQGQQRIEKAEEVGLGGELLVISGGHKLGLQAAMNWGRVRHKHGFSEVCLGNTFKGNIS